MRKALGVLLAMLATGAALPQSYEVYNKIGSDGIYETQDNGQGDGVTEGFGGMYNIAFGLINMDMFGAQAEYRLDLAPNQQYDEYTIVGSPIKANVWFRPARHLELVVGNNFYQALPGSFMNVFNEFTPNGWYGKKYFGATFVWGPLTAGLNIPHISAGGSLSVKANFGANLNLDFFNIGANYKMDSESFSLFANFTGVENLYLSAGYTYNGYAIGTANGYGDWRKILANPIVQWNDRYTKSHIVNFSGTLRIWRVTLGADLEASLNATQQNPFYAGGVVILELTEDLDLKLDVKYFTEFLNDSAWVNPWNTTIHPRFVFEDRHNQIIFGVKIDLHQWLSPAFMEARRTTYFAIPVSWKYKF